jgi:hypothetical protein
MARMTNLYAQLDKGKYGCSPDVYELRLFVAMMLSGYAILPHRKLYWNNCDDVFNNVMSDFMGVMNPL